MEIYCQVGKRNYALYFDLVLVIVASLLLGFETHWWCGVVAGWYATALLPDRK